MSLNGEMDVQTLRSMIHLFKEMDRQAYVQFLSGHDLQTNSTCFINCLPTEILEVIFIQCARDYYNWDIGQPIRTAPSWVNVSYVCRHWRNVALNCPTLWSYPFITSPRWTEELLARSQQAPLKLNVNLYRPDERREVDFVEQVTNHLERVLVLYLILTFSNYQLLSNFSSSAPRLQHLKISMEYYPDEWSPESFIFVGDTPALRTLELSICPVPWYSLKLNGLTDLRLFAVPDRFRQDMAQFFVTLSTMQDLVYLCLDDALPNATGFLSSTTFHRCQKVELPRLSHLSINAPVLPIVAFMSCVNIPLETEIKLNLDLRAEHNPPPVDDCVREICPLLAQRLTLLAGQIPSRQKIRSLAIREQGANITFSVSERDSDDDFAWNCNIPLQIFLTCDQVMLASDRDRIMGHVSCPVSLPFVQNLHILDPPSSPTTWTHILERIQDLRYLKLSEGDMPNMASLLSFSPHNGMENLDGCIDPCPDQILAPLLQGLELCDIRFPAELEEDVDPLEHPDVRALCDALSTRTEHRGRLIMTRCSYIERDSDEEKVFNMEGWWEDGRFRVVDVEYDSDAAWKDVP